MLLLEDRFVVKLLVIVDDVCVALEVIEPFKDVEVLADDEPDNG